MRKQAVAQPAEHETEQQQAARTKVIIQPTLPVLAQLLGGPDEWAVEFRESVVQQFARRYLKALVNSANLEAAKREEMDELRRHVNHALSGTEWGDALGKKNREEVRREVSVLVGQLIRTEVEARVNSLREELASMVKKEVERQVTAHVNQRVSAGVAEAMASIQRSATEAAKRAAGV
jgi:demethoxyubiquinone hydroxylase (CLK1/Coq7/Cat5 family)